jgi:hypothetical protein
MPKKTIAKDTFMNVVDEIERLTATKLQDRRENEENELDQLRQLEEVEIALKAIGVTLDPRFDISLTARIGWTSTKK